jgi:tetratricopeptide (TPR) repeat protein
MPAVESWLRAFLAQSSVALAQRRFDDAIIIFSALLEQGHAHGELRLNLAWALAMSDRFDEANMLLDDATLAASPRGPALKVHMLHHLGDLDEALRAGQELAALYPENQALMGALATLAMDAEATDLARAYAERAGTSADRGGREDHRSGAGGDGISQLS